MKELKELIGFYLTQIIEKGESALLMILNLDVPTEVLLMEYKRLKLRIEDLSQEEKMENWIFVNQHFPNKTKEQKINACKIIHLIASLF